MSKAPESVPQPAAFTTAEIAEFDRHVPRYQLDPIESGMSVHCLSFGASNMLGVDSWPPLRRPEAHAGERHQAIDGVGGGAD